MPRSKHRRKAGGKSVRHPGRRHTSPYRPTKAEQTSKAFSTIYKSPFHSAHPNGQSPETDAAAYLLDILEGHGFDPFCGGKLRQISGVEAREDFLRPIEDVDTYTPEMAETALAILVACGLAEIDGEHIRIPAKFWPQTEGLVQRRHERASLCPSEIADAVGFGLRPRAKETLDV